jgi:hypothetical protein
VVYLFFNRIGRRSRPAKEADRAILAHPFSAD